VHKLRNIQRKAPKHAYDEIKADYHAIVYADDEKAARTAYQAFCRKWGKSAPASWRASRRPVTNCSPSSASRRRSRR
jgi:transposase-like protein